MTDLGARAASGLGLLVMMALAWAASSDRRRVPWRTLAWGLALQLGLGALLLKTSAGGVFFDAMRALVGALLRCTDAGVHFVFGEQLAALEDSFAINVLPIIVFMGSVFAVLYHLGVMQRVVNLLARVLARTMGVSGAESLAAVANLFVGMVESALVVRPYLAAMTRSELFAVMTLGMATVAGSVMLAYVRMLGPDFAGHLATASLISLPAGLMLAKLMVPEEETPRTLGGAGAEVETAATNVIDAAAQGALAGLRLAAYVGALLVAFVGLIALVNDVLGGIGGWVGIQDLTLQRVLGVILAPLAWLMGVAWEDAARVGALLGLKTVLNEFIAYRELGEMIQAGTLQRRSAVIASYALCGFANLGSLAILLGGIGGLAPSRRPEVARLGLRSILSGSLAAFMTACVAGMLL